MQSALAGFLPVTLEYRRMGPHLGRARAAPTAPAISARWRGTQRFCRTAARPGKTSRRASSRACTAGRPRAAEAAALVNVGVTMDVVPLQPASALRAARVRDTLGRPLRDLRISVTDRCNFRCPYCMPRERFHEHYRFLKSAERLIFEEIVRLTRLFVQLGVRKLRITGGEPLLRAGLEDLVGDLTTLPGIEDVALTTNGVLLRASMRRGCAPPACSASRSASTASTRPSSRAWPATSARVGEVLAGIERRARAGLAPIKINVVVQRGVNDHTVLELVERFRGTGHHRALHRIHGRGQPQRLACRRRWCPRRELIARIGERWPLQPAERQLSRRGRVALRVRGRRRRAGLHLLDHAALLRRLLARAAVVQRRAVHLPVRHAGSGPARAAARRRQRRRTAGAARAATGPRAPTATANCAAAPTRTASGSK